MIKPRVYVNVLNWNRYEDTKKCLESLEKVSYSNLKTIFLDNGSVDGSGPRLEAEFPGMQFISDMENSAFYLHEIRSQAQMETTGKEVRVE